MTDACPRCETPLLERASWCLECGYAARTRFLRAKGWRLPLLAASLVSAAAIVALVVAFAVLTRNDNQLPAPAATPVVAPAAPTP